MTKTHIRTMRAEINIKKIGLRMKCMSLCLFNDKHTLEDNIGTDKYEKVRRHSENRTRDQNENHTMTKYPLCLVFCYKCMSNLQYDCIQMTRFAYLDRQLLDKRTCFSSQGIKHLVLYFKTNYDFLHIILLHFQWQIVIR